MAEQAQQLKKAPQQNQAPKKKTFREMSPKERTAYFAERKENKLRRANDDNTSVVNTKTLDASYFTQFINSLDYTMDTVRKKFSTRGSKITAFHVEEATKFLDSITSLMNLFCSKTSKMAGLPYRTPRGHLDLTKQSTLRKSADELEAIIGLLSDEHDRISKLADEYEKSQQAAKVAAESKAAAAPAAAPAAKKPAAKKSADSGTAAQAA